MDLESLRSSIVRAVETRDDVISKFDLDVEFGLADRYWHINHKSTQDVIRYTTLRDCPLKDITIDNVKEWGIVFTGPQSNHISMYRQHVDMLQEHGILDFLSDTDSLVFEIGAGYGVLANALLGLMRPSTQYVICDLPESLLFSGLFLALNGKKVSIATPDDYVIGDGVTLIPNYLFQQFQCAINLAISNLALGEMSEYQCEIYLKALSKLLVPQGMLFEMNDQRHFEHPSIFTDNFAHMRYLSEVPPDDRLPIYGEGVPRLWFNDTSLGTRLKI